MKLDDWQKALIREGELYRVGGSVRDALLGIGHTEQDVDYLVRGVPPDRFEKLLTGYGRLVHVGKSFGVYKFKPKEDEGEVDIAFPRREVSTGPGHREFDVDWGAEVPIVDDLRRRDFTMNAIAQNVADGAMIDPFAGAKDIAARTLRMIFAEAFTEDALRILRGIRFAARFDLEIDPRTAQAMTNATPLLATLSAERLQDELTKTLTQCQRPSVAFATMHAMGVLSMVLPELERTWGAEQNEHHIDDLFWHTVKTCDAAPQRNLVVRWAALLHDLGKLDTRQTIVEAGSPPRVVFYGHQDVSAKIAETVLTRFRYSQTFIRRCVHLVRHHMLHYQPDWNRSTVRRFIRTIGEAHYKDLIALNRADVMSRNLVERAAPLDELRQRIEAEIADARALKTEDLAIDGDDVMKFLGLGPGEAVGEVLHEALERVIEDPSANDRDKLIAWLRERRRED